ncbi:hypothetical protein, partial [Jannaschia sp. LMIT008]|uniref:hypothetical protein n=1 Tax=Jannaschia maritima TaxID=3032585 RepID=UPI0028122835
EIQVDGDLMDALGKLDDGDLAGAADAIAYHEQVEVVQPVYERHRDAFKFLSQVDGTIPGDQTSIPVSYECGGDTPVTLGDLEIREPLDRVKYYRRLMDRMREIEGIR